MFNFGWFIILVTVYPLWGLVTPLLIAGVAGGLVGCIIASIGIVRSRAPWYAALKYLAIGLICFTIWWGGDGLFDPWRQGRLAEWITFGIAALPTTGLILFRARRWVSHLWDATNGEAGLSEGI